MGNLLSPYAAANPYVANIEAYIGQYGTGLLAWQAAAADLNSGKITTLNVNTPQTILRASLSNPLTQGLITFTNNPTIVFGLNCPVSYDYQGLPLFCFSGCTDGGIKGKLKFIYTGTVPATAPYTRSQYSAQSGFNNNSFFGGGDYELFTAILSNSSGMTFDDVRCVSATPNNNNNIVVFVFNFKPTDYTTFTNSSGNVVKYAFFQDYMFGILGTGQNDLHLGIIRGNRRGATTNAGVGPGHVVYCGGLTTSPVTPNMRNYYERIIDGPDLIGWPANVSVFGGSVSLKEMQNGTNYVGTIVCQNASGAMQTVQDFVGNIVDVVDWYTTDTNPPQASSFNFVNTVQNNMFGSIMVYAPSQVGLIGWSGSSTFSGNKFGRIYAYMSMDRGSTSNVGMLDFQGSNNTVCDINIEQSAAIVGSTYVTVAQQRSSAGANNYFDGKLIGPFVDYRTRYFVDAGATSNSNSTVRYLTGINNNDFMTNTTLTVTNGTMNNTGLVATRGWNTDAGGSGATTIPGIQLPGSGAYIVFVSVCDNAKNGSQSAMYNVIYSAQTGNIANVQLVGAIVTVGSSISALGLTVTDTGAMTLAYTKGSSFFGRYAVSWTQHGGLTPNQ